jgi:tetratricopeptide (TPR) repeat protein
MKLDPFHPTWSYFPVAHYHFQRGEYDEALVAARKINLPGFFWSPTYLAAIYAELGRYGEARSALEELLGVYPGFTVEKLIEERRKWNESENMIRRWVAALRKAGLPE